MQCLPEKETQPSHREPNLYLPISRLEIFFNPLLLEKSDVFLQNYFE